VAAVSNMRQMVTADGTAVATAATASPARRFARRTLNGDIPRSPFVFSCFFQARSTLLTLARLFVAAAGGFHQRRPARLASDNAGILCNAAICFRDVAAVDKQHALCACARTTPDDIHRTYFLVVLRSTYLRALLLRRLPAYQHRDANIMTVLVLRQPARRRTCCRDCASYGSLFILGWTA